MIKEFIDTDGLPVNDCVLSLSLRDFVCCEKATELGDFENVPFDISSTTLYEFYKRAFAKQIANEAADKIDEVQEQTDDALSKISTIDNIISERGKKNGSNQIVLERKQLVDVRASMVELRDESAKIASLMKDIEATMDKVGDRVGVMKQVEKVRLEAASKVAQVETGLAMLTAEEGNLVESSIRSRVRSTFRSSFRN